MSDHSHIQWTDSTWNPIRGCSRVSAGCQHCYAETMAKRFSGPGMPYEGLLGTAGRWNGQIRVVPELLDQPLRWRKPRRVFVNSMSDLFHEGVPRDFILRVFMVMRRASHHTFQVLTKRPERMRRLLSEWLPPAEALADMSLVQKSPAPNVWLGVSVEDQATADERIPLLLATPAAARFVSAEPLLGPVGFPFARIGEWNSLAREHGQEYAATALDWVIVGGESGPRARPCAVDWVRSIVEQCRAAGTACFVKQLGASPVEDGCESGHVWVGRSPQSLRRIADRAGSDPAEWPADLRVREFPA